MNVSVITASVFAVMEIIGVANAQPAIPRDALPASGASAYPPQQQEGAAPPPGNVGPNAFPPPAGQPGGYAALPPDYQPEVGKPKELPPRLRRQLVDFSTEEPAGTLICIWCSAAARRCATASASAAKASSGTVASASARCRNGRIGIRPRR